MTLTDAYSVEKIKLHRTECPGAGESSSVRRITLCDGGSCRGTRGNSMDRKGQEMREQGLPGRTRRCIRETQVVWFG